jgi:hypothetical protein
MEQWWNEIDRENPKYSDRNLSPCQFYTANFTWTGLRLNPALHASNGLSQGMVVKVEIVLNYIHIFRSYLIDSGLCDLSKNKSVDVQGNKSAFFL